MKVLSLLIFRENEQWYNANSRFSRSDISIGFKEEFDIDGLRERLREMTDKQLLSFGKDARYMCSSYANMGQKPREVFVVQLEEARAESKRRKSKQNSG